MATSGSRFNRRLEGIFQAEAIEHLDRISSCLAALQARQGEDSSETVQQLFRAAHSLKGAARAVGRGDIEAICHASEGLLAALQHGRLAWSPPFALLLNDAERAMRQALSRAVSAESPATSAHAALVERIRQFEQVGATDVGPAAAAAPASAPVLATEPASPPAADAAATQTVRVSADRLSRLLAHAEQLMAVKEQAHAHAIAVEAAGAIRELRDRAWQQQRQLARAVDLLLSDIKAALLVPAASLAPFLFATVRELSRSLGKDVELALDAGDVEIDRRVLEELREPLVHLMRNAVAHGIEPPTLRQSAGKPAQGALTVRVCAKPGALVSVTVQDDGGGIDTAALARAAREQHAEVPHTASDEELLPLIFSAGVSTASRLTPVAGRGIGLAIVRDTVERLGGTVDVASALGTGTKFTMTVPVSLATFRVVEVRAGGREFLLPSRQLDRCMLCSNEQLQRVGPQLALSVGEQSVPLASLAEMLELPPPAPRSKWTCLLLAGPEQVAVVVDEVVREREVISKPVAPSGPGTQLVVGAAIVDGARTLSVLNPAEIARRALSGAKASALQEAESRATGRTILVAEDSITSRALLKNLLEIAGHKVETAVDGADALRKLRAGSFDVLVSDIEMPQLDGVELTRAIRADPALASLPVVLVTSLGSPADRERGAEAGADAYIVKSDFDQANLLRTIEELA